MNIRDIPLAKIVFDAFDDINGDKPMACAYRHLVYEAEASSIWRSKQLFQAQDEIVKTLIRIMSHYRLNSPFTSMNIHNSIIFARIVSGLKLSGTTTIATPDMTYFSSRGSALLSALVQEIRIPKNMFRISSPKHYRQFIQNVSDPEYARIRISGPTFILEKHNQLFVELKNLRALKTLTILLGETGFIISEKTLKTLNASADLRNIPIFSPYHGESSADPKTLSSSQINSLEALIKELTEFYQSLGT